MPTDNKGLTIEGLLTPLFTTYYFLNNFTYKITVSIYPFIIGFIALLSLTLLVVLSRAYQATRIDILHYLKYK